MKAVTKEPGKSVGRRAKQSATVHISEGSHLLLREMAAQEGVSMQSVLGKALEQYQRQKFWEGMKVAYAAIQSDPEAMAAEKKEFALWEATLMDGLDSDETWGLIPDAQ